MRTRIKKNAKSMDWKVIIGLAVIIQFLLPLVFSIWERYSTGEWTWNPTLIATGFAGIFIYSTVIKLLFWGEKK